MLALEQGKWQACIFPLFAAFSSTEEPTEAEQRLFALVMNVVALIHFSYLMKGGDGKRGAAFKYMKTSLQRLKIFFKEWNKQTLDLASLMLSSLLHLVEKRAVAKKMLDNFLYEPMSIPFHMHALLLLLRISHSHVPCCVTLLLCCV